MVIPQSIKDKAKWTVYLTCANITDPDNTSRSVMFSIGDYMYIASNTEFNQLLLNNTYIEQGYGYDVDTAINGTYISNEPDKQYFEYFVDYVLPDYNTGIPYVIFRVPGTVNYQAMTQSSFVELIEVDDPLNPGMTKMEPRYEFIGYKYKTTREITI